MNKNLYVAIACCSYGAAVLLIAFGTGFSWHTLVVIVAALLLWNIGDYLWKATFAPSPFLRLQFRIGIFIGEAYSSTLETNIDLPAFGDRIKKRTFQMEDQIEMRTTGEGYELVLLTREVLYSHGSTRGKGLVLFSLPYMAFWSLQKGYKGFDQAKEILTAAGLNYWHDEETNVWEYRNRYGTFRWWDV